MVRTSRSARNRVLVALFVAAFVTAGCSGGPGGAPCDPCAAPATAGCPPADLPTQAQAGEAWCRVWVDPEYAAVAETVCVKPAVTKKQYVPARYDVRPKLVCVEPACMNERIQPAVFATKKRQVMTCGPREEIKRICCPPSTDLDSCEIQTGCYTKIVHPPRYETEECPVCVSPERRCLEYSPPRYMVISERYEAEPGRCQESCEPPQFETRVRQVMVRPGRWEWQRNDGCSVPVGCAPTTAQPCAQPPY